VTREHPLSWHRLLPLALLVALGVVAFLALRGPGWYQRLYYPLHYTADIRAAAGRHRINPYLIAAVIQAESGFRADTVSKAGAVGLMQVLPATARELRERKLVDESVVGGKPLTDPVANIEYGTAYVRYLVNRYHEVETALAAYNAGLGRVDVWAAQGGDIKDQIAFPETRRYVSTVVRARERYERLYPHTFDGWEEGQ
jgi:soluble lytic murein transglycosylase